MESGFNNVAGIARRLNGMSPSLVVAGARKAAQAARLACGALFHVESATASAANEGVGGNEEHEEEHHRPKPGSSKWRWCAIVCVVVAASAGLVWLRKVSYIAISDVHEMLAEAIAVRASAGRPIEYLFPSYVRRARRPTSLRPGARQREPCSS